MVPNGKVYAPCGFTTTFPSPPDTNLAKSDPLRCHKSPRMVRTACHRLIFLHFILFNVP